MRITGLSLFLFLFGCTSHPVNDIPQTDVVKNPALVGSVDVVRDQWGIPHIYGDNEADVAFAQGYVTAQDRLLQMDLTRHSAAGTLAELLGDASPALIDSDIQMRVHHFSQTVAQAWQTLSSSTDAKDQTTAKMLTSYAAGVNAYIADLQSQKFNLAPALGLFYNPATIKPWTETDCLLVGQRLVFELSYDADSDIFRSQLEAAAKLQFDQSANPALAARKGIGDDFEILAPADPTYTLPSGWTGMNGDTSRAAREVDSSDAALLALLGAARKSVRGMGHDHQTNPSLGSNNWVVGPQLSKTGHVMVANDTHLSLQNPPIFYLVHLVARGKLDAMGVQFPGLPGIILGMNEHVAWGSTVNNIDITDVYQESIVTCADGTSPCVAFNGGKVPLVPRQETINVGRFGDIVNSVTVTLYDVPHHGPIIPRVNSTTHAVEPLGSTELSVRYTAHDPAPRLAAVLYGLDTAKSMKDALAAIDGGFLYGNQNWVIGDDQGHFGWTQFTRTPRRAGTAAPWKILPGDGSAEWGGDMDPIYIPHAYDPAAGFIATANNDPIGVTDDNDPFFDEPMVDGAPLYLGADYDPGTRVGRITKRIKAVADGGGKLGLDDMQSIQADVVSEWAQALVPNLLTAAQALQEEVTTPGTHPELSTLAAQASPISKQLLPMATSLVQNWSTFSTESGVAEDAPTDQQLADAEAAVIAQVWIRRFADRTFGDELEALNGTSANPLTPSSFAQLKLLALMCTNSPLLHMKQNPATGEPIAFDELDTPEQDTKRTIAAHAILDTLDFLVGALGQDITQWRWGNLHTLTLRFLAPIAALQIPLKTDPMYPNGFPRHGDIGTVDAASDSIDIGDYSYDHGPAIRFVAELDPKGPHARNVLPGGEVLDPMSPHYRDQMELYRKNKTIDLAFGESDVAASAKVEFMKNGDGRVHFSPK
ncbi:MAG TPA: penicillin acylase family protein [Polyangia bacterium]